MLADLHDHSALLAQIEADPKNSAPLDEARVGPLGVYVLVVTSTAATSYRIDPGVEAVLSKPYHAVDLLQALARADATA